MYAEGSFRHLPNRKTNAQKSQPPGFPVAGKWVTQDRPHQRDSSIGQALSAAQQSFDLLHSAATGHAHTRGEGVILGYAPNKRCESASSTAAPKPLPKHTNSSPSFPTHIQERIGLRPDPQVYPCEYVSKRRRPTTHELLAITAMMTINIPIIADHASFAPPSLVGLRVKRRLTRQTRFARIAAYTDPELLHVCRFRPAGRKTTYIKSNDHNVFIDIVV